MSLEGIPVPLPDAEDFGLAGHLASIERMHREALAQVDALLKPWGNLWSPRPGVVTSPGEEQPEPAAHRMHGAHAAAA